MLEEAAKGLGQWLTHQLFHYSCTLKTKKKKQNKNQSSPVGHKKKASFAQQQSSTSQNSLCA